MPRLLLALPPLPGCSHGKEMSFHPGQRSHMGKATFGCEGPAQVCRKLVGNSQGLAVFTGSSPKPGLSISTLQTGFKLLEQPGTSAGQCTRIAAQIVRARRAAGRLCECWKDEPHSLALP